MYMYKGLLIDLGNTIIYNKNFDFNRGLINLYSHIVKPQISIDQFLNFAKQFTKDTYDNREQFEINFQSVLNYFKLYFNIIFDLDNDQLELEFAKHCEEVELVPGIEVILNYFYQINSKIVILSNSTFQAKTLLAQIEPLKIIHYIDHLLSSADCLYRKPYPYFFELGIKCLGLERNEILYIGNDYYYDILGANQVNLNCCWFNENQQVNDKNIKCIEIKNYFELLDYLNNNRE